MIAHNNNAPPVCQTNPNTISNSGYGGGKEEGRGKERKGAVKILIEIVYSVNGNGVLTIEL